MGSEQLPLRSSGIYHSLPQFDPAITNLTAIVTGANGISGFQTCRALLESGHRWAKILALSRRPPPPEMLDLLPTDQKDKIQHVAVDFLQSPEDILQALNSAGVHHADYVFFYSYLQPKPDSDNGIWSNAQELVDVNSTLLRNFLQALSLAKLQPKRILLQTGAKNYGLHIGRGRTPCVESDPQPSHLQPNFYYAQEALLFDYCRANPETSWSVIRPSWIIGATSNAQMTAMYPYAVYAAVCAERGEKLAYPLDWSSYQGNMFHSTAKLTGYLSEWAILEDKCRNQAFNSQDTCPISADRFFESLCRWFGVADGVQPPADDGAGLVEIPMGTFGKESPMGYGPQRTLKASFSLKSWAQKDRNHAAWKQIMKKSGTIKHDPFQDLEVFESADMALLPGAGLSMSKARRLGWTGYVDTLESIFEMFVEMGDGPKGLRMIPEMVVDHADAMV